MKDIKTNILHGLEKGEEISPFLFIETNTELLLPKIKALSYEILDYFSVPKNLLYIFDTNEKNIKISDIKKFLVPIHTKSNYKIQIFIIPNIGNLTLGAGNSLLKVLEEPGFGNIIFLSNNSESNILETILSRVQIISEGKSEQIQSSGFYYDLIDSYIQGSSQELLIYFYKSKTEVDEAELFLHSLLGYIKKHKIFLKHLDVLEEDITKVKNNNLNPKYIVDYWIFTISH